MTNLYGHCTNEWQNDFQLSRYYDTLGRNTGYAINGTRQTTIAYDTYGRIATMTVPTTEEGENVHSPTPTPNSNSFHWTYAANSDLKASLQYPNGLSASWTYDANNQLLQVFNATPTNVISQYDYTYDAAGRRVACGKSGCAFAQNDTLSYCYNEKSELTNAVAAVDSGYRYAYDFDDIGNRKTSAERGVQSAEYMSNELNQYTNIDYSAVSPATCHLSPTYDADGNQTLVKTATGIWSVTYNGENRPILWVLDSDNATLAMTYDHMGRRRTKDGQRFFYDGYLQVANERTVSSAVVYQSFVWNPTEPVATRPLAWFGSNEPPRLYTHDGNKNVSEVVAAASGTNATVEVVAHYDYAAFGAVLAQKGDCAEANPWRFSSEYEDTDLGLDYYNYRHYEPMTGRWLNRDPIEESGGLLLYSMCNNSPLNLFDERGRSVSSWCECFSLCVTYNISQTWKMILAIDSAIAALDAAMETPFGSKAFNLGTEKVTSIGNKIFQLIKSSKSPIVKKMLKPLASWARTSGSMEWLPGLRSSSSLTRRIAKSLRMALRAARGLGTAALASVVLIEGKCASSCLYEDVQFEFKELLENYPEEFLFSTANE